MPKNLKNLSILLLLSLIWGSSFILIKKGLADYSSMQVAAMRLSFAGISIIPILFFVKWPKQKKDWLFLLLCGTLGNFFPAFLFSLAQQNMSSSLAGAFNSLTPLFTLLGGIWIFKIKMDSNKFLGVFIGLAGSLLLIFSKNFDAGIQYSYTSALMVITAACFYGINANIIKTKLAHLPALTVGIFPVVLISIPSIIIALSLDVPTSIIAHSDNLKPLWSIVILGVLGTALALIVFNAFIQNTTALFASSVTYLLPFVAAVWGFFDGEYLGIIHFISLALIIVGIYLTRR